MPFQSASIQSYFSSQPSPSKSLPSCQASSTNSHPEAAKSNDMSNKTFIPGDGFTAREIANSPGTQPVTGPFTPLHGIPYQEVSLLNLSPTDFSVTFTGRIVNIYAAIMRRAPKIAKGCLRCTVSDGEGAVTVSRKQLSTVFWVSSPVIFCRSVSGMEKSPFRYVSARLSRCGPLISRCPSITASRPLQFRSTPASFPNGTAPATCKFTMTRPTTICVVASPLVLVAMKSSAS